MVSCATHIGRNRTWINCEIIPFSPFLTISLAKANLKDLSVHLSLFRQFGLMFIRIWEERLPFVFTAHLLFIQYDRQDSFVLRPPQKKTSLFVWLIRVCTTVHGYNVLPRVDAVLFRLALFKIKKKVMFFCCPGLGWWQTKQLSAPELTKSSPYFLLLLLLSTTKKKKKEKMMKFFCVTRRSRSYNTHCWGLSVRVKFFSSIRAFVL